MKTVVSKEGHEVSVGDNGPTILIGEQINPTGKKRLAESLRAGDLSIVRELALSQVKDGAAILDVNVVAPGVNETDTLPKALEAVRRVRDTLGVNQTLGASNISFGLPNRMLVNQVFLSMAIQAGVTCPTVNPAMACSAALAADLILGRDRFAMRFMKDYQVKQEV